MNEWWETVRDAFAAEAEVAEVYPKPVALNEQEVEEEDEEEEERGRARRIGS
jgi:hypothetical protein